MQRRRTFLLGLLVVAPAALSPALGQNAPPQVLAQSATAQAAIPQAEGESQAWRATLQRVAESVELGQ